VVRSAIAFLIIVTWLSSTALAEKRVALIIGNGAYTRVPKLENPRNDAAAMEVMLKAAGFDTVVRVNDLGVAAMRRALREFSDTAFDADIAVFFYAGHGMEVSGTNYLIPTDAVLERDIDARDEAVSLDRVSEILEPVKRLRFIILDACRDNPFVRSMRRTLATRTVRSGHGEIDETSLPPNTLVAYAQRAGATAEDGAGTNSPYTTALLKHLPTPGLDVELALRRVRDDVLKATRNRQEPFRYGSVGGAEVALVAARTQPFPEKEQGEAAQKRIKYEQAIRNLSGWIEVDYGLPIDQAIASGGFLFVMNPISETGGNGRKQLYVEFFSCAELAAETEDDVWKALAERKYRPATGRELLAFVASHKELPPPITENLLEVVALGGVRADDHRRWSVLVRYANANRYRMLFAGNVWDGCRGKYLIGVPK
jgi:hypothetical protein